jgi:hypothetical protein
MIVWVAVTHMWIGQIGYSIQPSTNLFTTREACERYIKLLPDHIGTRLDYVCEPVQVKP